MKTMKFLFAAVAMACLVAAPRMDAWCIQQNQSYCSSTFGASCLMGSANQKCFYDGGGCRSGCGTPVMCDPFDPCW